MKIKANILKNFIDKASLGGHIMTINLNFEESGLSSCVRDAMNVSMTNTFLKADAFTDYERIGELFIKDSSAFSFYLKSFQDEVAIEKLDNYMIRLYDGTRDAYIILGSDIVCDNVYRGELPVIESDAILKVCKDDFKVSITDAKKIGVNVINLSMSDGELRIGVGDKGQSDFFVSRVKVNTDKVADVNIGPSFFKFLEIVSSDFNLGVKSDYPIVINEENADIKFKAIIAPVMSE